MPMNIKTFGPVDERSLKQLERCMEAGDAEHGVLCADHHPGYSQPIGGAVAYEDYVSPSGVGYDIGCVAAGEPVLCADGVTRAIEHATRPLCADHKGVIRPVDPCLGVVGRGIEPVRRVVLANGRCVTVTGDHELRTDHGWVAADELMPGHLVLCAVYAGIPYEASDFEPALLRIAGYVNGDGQLSKRDSRVCLYTSQDADAAALAADMSCLGLTVSIHRRVRPTGSVENAVYVNNPGLHGLLEALGCPVGRNAAQWGDADVLRGMPAVARASYLSSFASAEMSTPRLVAGRIANLAIKQRGTDAAAHVEALVRSLGFDVGISRSDGENWVIQILGGEEGQLRFLEQIGFNRCTRKRLAAASVVSAAWERRVHVDSRHEAQRTVRRRIAASEPGRLAVARVAGASGMTQAAVLHLAYRHGSVRAASGWRPERRSLGECAYSSVIRVEDAGERQTFDIATADPTEAFIAGGIVVHNCGNKAVRTELTGADLNELGGVERIMREITHRVSFGVGVPARERVGHPVLDKIRHAEFAPQRRLAGLAESQLGTVGSGNHYVNLMEDERGRVWVGVHFGSRGFGHKTASGFLALARGLAFDARAPEGQTDSPPVLLETGTELGDSYIAAMQLAGEYAYAGRDAVVDKVLEILSTAPVHEVHNHHNFAWREQHQGRSYWVIRKGCTPARPGQQGFVGGSMGDASVILEGVESSDAEAALFSTVHGAGRIMSRSQAAGRVRRRKRWACDQRGCERLFESPEARCPEHPGSKTVKTWLTRQVRPGKVDWPAVQARLREQGIVLLGGGADEAPEVYKRLPDVLEAHAGSIRIKHTLRPLGVAMAGRHVYDPYKD